jgi:hypothetical protein
MMGCACNKDSLQCSDFCASTGGGSVTPYAWYPGQFLGSHFYEPLLSATGVSGYKKTPSANTRYIHDWVEDASTKSACEHGCSARALCIATSQSPSVSVSPSMSKSVSSTKSASSTRSVSSAPPCDLNQRYVNISTNITGLALNLLLTTNVELAEMGYLCVNKKDKGDGGGIVWHIIVNNGTNITELGKKFDEETNGTATLTKSSNQSDRKRGGTGSSLLGTVLPVVGGVVGLGAFAAWKLWQRRKQKSAKVAVYDVSTKATNPYGDEDEDVD